MTLQISDAEFEKTVLKAEGLVLVDFWAEWCGPCRQLAPTLDAVAKEMEGVVTIAKVNIDQNPETPQKYGIRGVPTLLLFKKGQLIATKVGGIPKPKLTEWLKSFA